MKKKYEKIVLLGKSKLNFVEVLLSEAFQLTDRQYSGKSNPWCCHFLPHDPCKFDRQECNFANINII